MNSARDNIVKYLQQQYPNWVHSGEIQRVQIKNRDGTTAMPNIVARRMRELECEHIVAVKYESGSSLYKFIPETIRNCYRTSDKRKEMFGKQNNEMWTIPKEQVLAKLNEPSQLKII